MARLLAVPGRDRHGGCVDHRAGRNDIDDLAPDGCRSPYPRLVRPPPFPRRSRTRLERHPRGALAYGVVILGFAVMAVVGLARLFVANGPDVRLLAIAAVVAAGGALGLWLVAWVWSLPPRREPTGDRETPG